MGENSKIEWTDHLVKNPKGRVLGAYKTAAARTGCSLEAWTQYRSAGNRWCFRCRTWKPAHLFSLDKSRLGGHASSCKECTSDASTASRYGMSLNELRVFRITHKHECGICHASEIVYIDHDHATGSPRGLLCPSCNSAIGLLGESAERLSGAIAYLGRHNG